MATYKPIQSVVVPSAVSSVTISGIDQSYTDLILVSTMRYTSTNVGQGLQLRFNSDSSASYSATVFEGDGSSASSYRSTNATGGIFNAPSKGDQTSFSPVITHINNYTNATAYKTWISRSSGPTYVDLYAGRWAGTPQAITSITILASASAGSIDAGCTFDLYGVKSGAPQAIGGDLVTTDGNYWYHTFRSTQTFTPLRALTVDYLVVAGGGGGGGVGNGVNGGYPGAGGGGAGGYRTSIGGSTLSVNSQNYTVTVGAGGAGKYLTGGTGASGSNSVFSTITSAGGGGGASHGTGSGLSGGSGGGASTSVASGGAGNTPSTSPSQGNNGGAYTTGDGGAGGGGASAVGGSVSSTAGGAGGAGAANSISGTSVTYAGGGGGGSYSGGTGGAGGAGGGGSGGTYNSGGVANGTANLGGGGGGAGQISTTSGLTGGNGGSGVVVVRYPV